MKTGTTKSGFKYTMDPTSLQDMRVLDSLADVIDPDAPEIRKIVGMSKLTEMILGADQKKTLYAHIASQHDGKVPPAALEVELTEMLSEGEAKN